MFFFLVSVTTSEAGHVSRSKFAPNKVILAAKDMAPGEAPATRRLGVAPGPRDSSGKYKV